MYTISRSFGKNKTSQFDVLICKKDPKFVACMLSVKDYRKGKGTYFLYPPGRRALVVTAQSISGAVYERQKLMNNTERKSTFSNNTEWFKCIIDILPLICNMLIMQNAAGRS